MRERRRDHCDAGILLVQKETTHRQDKPCTSPKYMINGGTTATLEACNLQVQFTLESIRKTFHHFGGIPKTPVLDA